MTLSIQRELWFNDSLCLDSLSEGSCNMDLDSCLWWGVIKGSHFGGKTRALLGESHNSLLMESGTPRESKRESEKGFILEASLGSLLTLFLLSV